MSPQDAPLRRGTSAETIARHLRGEIEAGVYRHGQQLPSTRTLAAEWGTSVATVTRAMQLLATDGLVTSRDRSSRVVNYPHETTEVPARITDMGTVELAVLVADASAELARRLRSS